ncbi:MAG: hypothetical protein ACKV0T_28200 [Planctomycetales bacterium]
MPATKATFFVTDRWPRWRKALAAAALWWRLRFRRNPGFATAAVAGSIGLALALFLLINSALSWLGASPDFEADETPVASLGDPGETPDSSDGAESLREPVSVSGAALEPGAAWDGDEDSVAGMGGGMGGGSGQQRQKPQPVSKIKTTAAAEPRRHNFDDAIDMDDGDDEDAEDVAPLAAVHSPVSPAADPQADHPFGDQGSAGDEQTPVTVTSILSPASTPTEDDDSDPFPDDPEETAPVAARQPAASASEAAEAEEPEPAASEQEPLATTTVVAAQPDESTDDSAVEDEDASFLQPKSKGEWTFSNSATDRQEEPEESSAEIAEPADPAPEPTQKKAEPQKPVHAPEPPRTAPPTVRMDKPIAARPSATEGLTLVIQSPTAVAQGEPIDLDFLVTNTSGQGVEHASLSVSLPDGLSHRDGPYLVQEIASLGPGKTHRARLRVTATARGEYSPHAVVEVDDRIGAQAKKTLRVSSGNRRVIGEPACQCSAPAYGW